MSETDVLIWIRDNLSGAFLDGASQAANVLSNGIVFYALGLLLLIPRRTRCAGALVIAAGILSDLLEYSLKAVIDRDRPFETNGWDILIADPGTSSFPSGHTANACILAAVAFLFDRRTGAVVAIWAAFVAFSRLYLLVHYPSDVVAGAVLAVLCVIIMYRVFGKYVEKTDQWGRFLGFDLRNISSQRQR